MTFPANVFAVSNACSVSTEARRTLWTCSLASVRNDLDREVKKSALMRCIVTFYCCKKTTSVRNDSIVFPSRSSWSQIKPPTHPHHTTTPAFQTSPTPTTHPHPHSFFRPPETLSHAPGSVACDGCYRVIMCVPPVTNIWKISINVFYGVVNLPGASVAADSWYK